MAGDDAVTAHEVACALAARGNVGFLARHLRPVEAPDAAKLRGHLADLDSADFATRQRAERALAELEELAEPALRKAVAEGASPEVRRRAETILEKLDASPPSAKTIQALRAVEVLEYVGTAEARRILESLAEGTPAARLTQEAKAALIRLAKRPAPG